MCLADSVMYVKQALSVTLFLSTQPTYVLAAKPYTGLIMYHIMPHSCHLSFNLSLKSDNVTIKMFHWYWGVVQSTKIYFFHSRKNIKGCFYTRHDCFVLCTGTFTPPFPLSILLNLNRLDWLPYVIQFVPKYAVLCPRPPLQAD